MVIRIFKRNEISKSIDNASRVIRQSNKEAVESNEKVTKSNQEVANQIKKQNELLKKDLDTKDRVDISKKEYLELLECKKYKEKYLELLRPIFKEQSISDAIKQEFFEGKVDILRTDVSSMEDPMRMKIKVAIRQYFEVDDDPRTSFR